MKTTQEGPVTCDPKDPRIIKAKKLIYGKKILDIGCNNCKLLEEFDAEKYGIDTNPEHRQSCEDKGVRFTCMDIDGKKLPFQNECFDCVFAGELIEHLSEYKYTLGEIHRVLKTGGILVLTTPNLASFSQRIDLLFGKTLPQLQNKYHKHIFTKKEIVELLEHYGFNVEVISGSSIAFSSHAVPVLTRLSVWLASYFPSVAHHIIIKARKL